MQAKASAPLVPCVQAGRPTVGPVPGTEGLFVAAGHEGSGLTLGPASAELLRSQILGQQPALSEATVQALAVQL